MNKDPVKWLDFHLEKLSMSRTDSEWRHFETDFKLGEFLGDERSFVFKANYKDGTECVLKFFSGEDDEAAENEHAIISKLDQCDIPGVVKLSPLWNGICSIGHVIVLILDSDSEDSHDIPSSVEGILSLAKQLRDTLTKVHEAGFSHGDVKPCNFLWNDQQQKLTIVDWGEARHGRLSSIVSDCGGTLEYLSDERFKKGILSVTTIEDIQKADLWAAGLCIAELLSGDCAYDVESDVPRHYQLGNFMVRFHDLPHDEAWHIADDLLQERLDDYSRKQPHLQFRGQEIPWLGIGLISTFVAALAFALCN